MTATFVALAVSVVFGFLVVRAIGTEDTSWTTIAGASILIGLGSTAFVLELLSLASIPWRLSVVATVLLAAGTALWITGTRRGGIRHFAPLRLHATAIPFDIATILLIAGYAIFATLVPLPEHDFLAIWGLKGRTFWEARGIDWSFLKSPSNDFSHPDYPLLVPLMFDFVALFGGHWNDRWIGLLLPAICVGALLVARGELARTSPSPFLVAIATFALAGFSLTPWIGLADGVVAAYALASLALIRHGLDRGGSSALLTGTLLLGFAAMAKNEGLPTLAAYFAAAVAFTRDRRRTIPLFWPAFLIPLPWLITRAALRIDSGILRGSIAERAASGGHLSAVIHTLASQHIASRWLIAGMIVAAGLAIYRRSIRADAFAIAAVALQASFYVAAYFVASYDLQWLVRWSWERVASQFVLPAAFVACTLATRAAARTHHESAPMMGGREEVA